MPRDEGVGIEDATKDDDDEDDAMDEAERLLRW